MLLWSFFNNVLLSEWAKDYAQSFVNAKELQEEVDKYMAAYDQKKEEEERLSKEKEGVPDDDGWVTVTRQ